MKKIIIYIKCEPIKLGQLLKAEGIINSGFEAKFFLHENKVYVNNEKEDRRGRKIFFNDVINVNNTEYLISKENNRGQYE